MCLASERGGREKKKSEMRDKEGIKRKRERYYRIPCPG